MLSLRARVYKFVLVTHADSMIEPLSVVKAFNSMEGRSVVKLHFDLKFC